MRLTQFIGTMHNICKVRGSKSGHKKNKYMGAANLHPPKNTKVHVSKLHPIVIDKNILNISFKTTTLMMCIIVTCFLFYFQIFYFFKYTTVLSDSCIPDSCNFHKFTNINRNHFSFVESLSPGKLGIVVY